MDTNTIFDRDDIGCKYLQLMMTEICRIKCRLNIRSDHIEHKIYKCKRWKKIYILILHRLCALKKQDRQNSYYDEQMLHYYNYILTSNYVTRWSAYHPFESSELRRLQHLLTLATSKNSAIIHDTSNLLKTDLDTFVLSLKDQLYFCNNKIDNLECYECCGANVHYAHPSYNHGDSGSCDGCYQQDYNAESYQHVHCDLQNKTITNHFHNSSGTTSDIDSRFQGYAMNYDYNFKQSGENNKVYKENYPPWSTETSAFIPRSNDSLFFSYFVNQQAYELVLAFISRMTSELTSNRFWHLFWDSNLEVHNLIGKNITSLFGYINSLTAHKIKSDWLSVDSLFSNSISTNSIRLPNGFCISGETPGVLIISKDNCVIHEWHAGNDF